jgi:RNA polymerase sigma-70 factor, ECF subfamily
MIDWSQIVEQHGPLVWRTSQRLLCHEADAADCFQRTFISALELSRTGTIRSWPAVLRRLATARALEQLRRRYRDRRRIAIDGDAVGVDCEIDRKTIGPESSATAAELTDHLRSALLEIDPRQAEVFCMASLDDCNHAEIGKEFGVTESYVGVLLHRAKTALREQLRAHDPKAGFAAEELGGNR